MNERWWMACCTEEAHPDVTRAIRTLEPEAKVVFVQDPQSLRASLAEGSQGSCAVAVGATRVGVSDINLAAAIVHDGLARRVVLMGHSMSGSMQARARRAGITEVLELNPPASPALVEVPMPTESVPDGATRNIPTSTCGEGQPNAVPSGTGKGLLQDVDKAYGDNKLHTSNQSTVPSHNSAGTQGSSGTGRGPAPVIVVSSGRGGVGKTTVVALAGLLAASWGMRVALVDLDLGCGNLFSFFGMARPPALDANLQTLPAKPASTSARDSVPAAEELAGLGVEVVPNVTLWGPCSRPEMAEKVGVQAGALLDLLASRHDLVFVDTSATCTDAVAQAFQHCSRLLLVHDENLTAIGSLSRTAALAVRLGVARTQIIRIANWGDRRIRFDLAVGRGELGLETARAFRVLDGGSSSAELMAAGKTTELAEEDADLPFSVAQMLARILDDLGCMPDSEGAREALAGDEGHGRRFRLFGRRAS